MPSTSCTVLVELFFFILLAIFGILDVVIKRVMFEIRAPDLTRLYVVHA